MENEDSKTEIDDLWDAHNELVKDLTKS